jgi:hypothetical protein
MKKVILGSPKLCKDSIIFAFVILGGIETAMSVLSLTLDCVDKVLARIGLVAFGYIIIVLIVFLVKIHRTKTKIELSIRGNQVIVKEGNIFETDGWKLIPFNERFDTVVDDKIIAHRSLNGIFIDNHTGDIEHFRSELNADDSSPLAAQKIIMSDEHWRYPLGTVKTYDDFILLALTHFNEQNEALTTRAEYEHTLRVIWSEISRVYAGKPINIPLIGSGITRFDDMTEKPNEQLLKCIICTLRTSNVTFTQPITVILTKSVLETVNLYELKGA